MQSPAIERDPSASPAEQAPASETKVLPMHDGARFAYQVSAVLFFLLFFTIPIALWIFVRLASAKVVIEAHRLTIRAMTTQRWDYRDLQRLGVMRVRVRARGIGGVLARKKCGGAVGINLCAMDARGKTRVFLASQYENHTEIIERVAALSGLPLEEVELGMLGPKWPKSM